MNDQQFQEVLKRIDELAEFGVSTGTTLSETLIREVMVRGCVMSLACFMLFIVALIVALEFGKDERSDSDKAFAFCFGMAAVVCVVGCFEWASEAMAPTLVVLNKVMP